MKKLLIIIFLIAVLVASFWIVGSIIKQTIITPNEGLPYTYLPGQNDPYLPDKFLISKELKLLRIDNREDQTNVFVGKYGEEESFNVISGRRGSYGLPGGKYELFVWVEKIASSDFPAYKKKAWESYQSFPKNLHYIERDMTGEYEYFLNYRKDLENPGLETKVVIGGGYLFFPEKNVVVVIGHMNSKLKKCRDRWDYRTCTFDETETLLSIDDLRNVLFTIAAKKMK